MAASRENPPSVLSPPAPIVPLSSEEIWLDAAMLFEHQPLPLPWRIDDLRIEAGGRTASCGFLPAVRSPRVESATDPTSPPSGKATTEGTGGARRAPKRTTEDVADGGAGGGWSPLGATASMLRLILVEGDVLLVGGCFGLPPWMESSSSVLHRHRVKRPTARTPRAAPAAAAMAAVGTFGPPPPVSLILAALPCTSSLASLFNTSSDGPSLLCCQYGEDVGSVVTLKLVISEGRTVTGVVVGELVVFVGTKVGMRLGATVSGAAVGDVVVTRVGEADVGVAGEDVGIRVGEVDVGSLEGDAVGRARGGLIALIKSISSTASKAVTGSESNILSRLRNRARPPFPFSKPDEECRVTRSTRGASPPSRVPLPMGLKNTS
mmetsp:Transcript_14450/g.42345  ORF Transcript_14450/g.42345 Transcript_14450/m.42345 type:complete len:378 (-) Transcript_14450:889-2022(-)